MKVDDQLIDRLAILSSLEIDEKNKPMFKNELGDIINFVDALNEVDVSNIDATFTTLQGGTPLREDVVEDHQKISDHMLTHGCKVQDRYFIVPKIIE